MEPLVCAVLVNYNGLTDTTECVKSLKECNYSNLKIVIVDNNSTINKAEYNESITEDCCNIICLDDNIGFAGANNIGINYALDINADYILIINNDTVVEKNFLNPLINVAENHSDVGIVTGKIYYFDDKDILWYGGSYYDNKLCEFKIDGIGDREEEKHNIFKETPFATGCLWLLPTETVKKVGLMSEDYFLYYEDADYCERVKLCNLKIYYEPKSVIYHKESRSTKKGSDSYRYYNLRNYLIFQKKFNKKYINPCFKKLLWAFKEVVRRRYKLSIFIKAYTDYLRKRKGK